MVRSILCLVVLGLVLGLCVPAAYVQRPDEKPADPLPSWKAGRAKKAIMDFVRETTDRASPKYVPPAARIATFDNDGTLWVEQPMYPEIMFALDRVKALAPQHPEWKSEQPFKGILEDVREAVGRLTSKDFGPILAATHTGMTEARFHRLAKAWLAAAKHPRYGRPYPQCAYQPMVEVMQYLRANGFRTYIVTGGGQAFVRTFSEPAYGVPVEHVVGSAYRLKYVFPTAGRPAMLRLPVLLLLDDEEGKPEDIEMFIGRKPLAAFGNSKGDRQMLEWTQSGGGPRLMMLVHHDDAEREYAYGAKSRVGTFPDSLMAEAREKGWVVISMRNDWGRIFAFEK